MTSLTVDALDLENGWVSVWGGKGGRDRVVPIGRLAASFVGQYVGLARPMLVAPDSPPGILFLSARGGRLSKNALLAIVQKHATSAGLARYEVTPHSFRHAFATHLVQNGAGLRHVQEMLGHAKLSTTQVYVHLAARDLKRVHHRTHPLG